MTLDVVIEIFSKIQKGQNILPLDSLCHFVLLYSGVALEGGLPHTSRSRTSLRSFRTHRSHHDISIATTAAATTISTTYTSVHAMDKHLPRPLEKVARGEAKGELEDLALTPSKGAHRTTLPMPQIQISIVPSLSCCPSVKAVLQGNQLCGNSNSQYVLRPAPTPALERPPKAEGSEERGLANSGGGGLSKDRSYASWFQQTFGTKLGVGPGSQGPGSPLTNSQMVSLHLQSSLPLFQEFPKPPNGTLSSF